MGIKRIGLLPSITDGAASHLIKAGAIVTREPHDMPKYGYAQAGHLGQDAGSARIPEANACVVWGKDEAKVGKEALRVPHAIMVIVLPKKPKKDSRIMSALERLSKHGCDIHVMTITARAKAVAYDVGTDRLFRKVEDMSRPPQQQEAPSIAHHRKKVEPVDTTAPSISHLRRRGEL